jgi:anaerobic ribonucleoside-triphosphate reductase activating protein
VGDETMNKIKVILTSSLNSDGLFYPSLSLYYSGCDKEVKCPECHNPELHGFENGFQTNTESLISELESNLTFWLSLYKRISISYLGGEPLAKWNRDSVLEVSKYFKEKYRDKICNVFYSWRYLEDLYPLKQYIEYMDFGVLGDFQIENRNIDYIPSSSNQYIYDFNNKTKINPIKKGYHYHGNE